MTLIVALALIGGACFVGTLLIARMFRGAPRHVPAMHPAAQSTPVATRAPQSVPPEYAAPTPHNPYERRASLLTQAEIAFCDVLRAAVPSGWAVYPQIRLASLVDVQRGLQWQHQHFNRIQAKCVDFVLCPPHSFEPRLVIELDDSSHQRADRRARDAFVDDVLAHVGLPILHVRCARRYDVEHLATQVTAALGHVRQAQPAYTPAPTAMLAPALEPSIAISMNVACGACGGEIRPTSRFCLHCGTQLYV